MAGRGRVPSLPRWGSEEGHRHDQPNAVSRPRDVPGQGRRDGGSHDASGDLDGPSMDSGAKSTEGSPGGNGIPSFGAWALRCGKGARIETTRPAATLCGRPKLDLRAHSYGIPWSYDPGPWRAHLTPSLGVQRAPKHALWSYAGVRSPVTLSWIPHLPWAPQGVRPGRPPLRGPRQMGNPTEGYRAPYPPNVTGEQWVPNPNAYSESLRPET